MSWINRLLYVVAILYGSAPTSTRAYTAAEEEALRTTLFTGYNNDVRPETPLDVTVTTILMSLNYLDIGAQEMSANIVIVSVWTDNRLAWTPASHNGIEALVVRYGTVWLPTLVIDNTIDDAGLFGADETAPIRILYTGVITWISPAFVRVSCNMLVTYFPFDQQSCIISVYGWAQDITEMNMTASSDPWLLNQYQEHGEWSLEGTSVSEYLATNFVNTFKSLYFRVTFKRKWQFPFLSLIVPGVLNSLLMCAVFCVPVEGSDKLGYSLTVLLSYYVLLTYVSDILPATSTNISLLQAYLTFVMMAGTMSTLASLWVVAIYNYDEDKPIPGWMAYLYHNVSAVILCRKGSCKKIAHLCHSCRHRRKASQVHQGRVKPLCKDEKKSKLSSGIATDTMSSLSYSRESCLKGDGVGKLKIETLSGQREITVKNMNEKSRTEELHHNENDVSIVSVDSGVTNVTKESKATPVFIDNNSVENSISKLCSHHDKSYAMFNQKLRDNTRCDDCEKCISVEEASNVVEEEEEKLTWKLIAERMDAVFFCVISGMVGLFTFILIIVLLAQY